MVDIETFKQMALSFDGALELPHFEKASFRINNKIFATLDVVNERACVKLNENDQSVFCTINKAIIYAVNNKWGKQGWTLIELKNVRKTILKDALSKSYLEATTKKKTA